MRDVLFVCAICTREIAPFGGNTGPDKQVAPICFYCEREMGDRPPQAGAFMDRRKVRQISALANYLNGLAHSRMWETRYAKA